MAENCPGFLALRDRWSKNASLETELLNVTSIPNVRKYFRHLCFYYPFDFQNVYNLQIEIVPENVF